QRVATRNQRDGIKIALDRELAPEGLRSPPDGCCVIDRDGINTGGVRIGLITLQRTRAWKADDLRIRFCCAYLFHNPLGRCDHPALEHRRRQTGSPAVEDLQRIRAAFELAD